MRFGRAEVVKPKRATAQKQQHQNPKQAKPAPAGEYPAR
jgi:hypothetical protein